MKQLFIVLALACASGCASLKGDDPRDPWEGLNRGVTKFNDTFDEYLATPVARTYVKVLHQEIRSRIANFFSNLADPFIGVNNFLQGKFESGVNDWARFAFNSTIGLLGIHDVASEMGLEKNNEDFGQTFGRWGAGPGPYLVLPILSSSTLRDTVGLGFDWTFDPLGEVRPINLRNSLVVLRGVNLRADLLEASRILEEAALDKYVFQRDAYLQRRQSLVYDGRPPREKLE
ncbi:MAG TPA: VacJ family lipoprotein [Burkholderiales bacterium]|nr:VacJ family lipoprotein [Burkholderiales bacterium]